MMSAMVESGRSTTATSSSSSSSAMHPSDKGYSTSSTTSGDNSPDQPPITNLQTVSDLLKERLIRHEDEAAATNNGSGASAADRSSPRGAGSNTAEYLSHSASSVASENGVHDLNAMVSRHVSMMGGNGDEENSDSANVLRGMLRGKNGVDSGSSNNKAAVDSNGAASSGNNSSMIGKLLQREHESAAGNLRRASSYDIDVDGDDSMPSVTTPQEFSSDELSDNDNNMRSSPTNMDFMDEDEEFNEDLNNSGNSSSSKSKRARVENIISSMNRSSSPVKETPVTPIDSRSRHKRKQYIPQQHDSARATSDEPEAKMRRLQQEVLQDQLKMMQDQLATMQQKYTDLYQQTAAAAANDEIDLAEVERRCHQRQQILNGMHEKENKIHELSKRHGILGPVEIDSSPFMRDAKKLVDGKFEQMSKMQISPLTGDTPKDLEHLAHMLKDEIRHNVGTLVDTVVARFVEESKRVQKEQSLPSQTASVPVSEPKEQRMTQAADLPSPTKERPSPCAPEPAKTPVSHLPVVPHPLAASPPSVPSQPTASIAQPSSQPPVLSHSIHKITNNNNNNNEIKPITIAPKTPDNTVSAFQPSPSEKQHHQQQQPQQPSPLEKLHRIEQPKPTRTKVTDKIIHPFFDHPKPSFADLLRHAPLFPPPPYFHPLPHPLPPMFPPHQPKISEPEPEQTEALALVVSTPKKKRTKVTDTRLSPRAARALLQEPVPTAQDPNGDSTSSVSATASAHFNGAIPSAINDHLPHHHHPPHAPHHHPLPPHSEPSLPMIHPNLLPVSLPTSVAIPNPSLQHSDILSNMYGSHQDHPASFPDFSSRVPTSRSPSVRDHGSPSMHPHDYGMFNRGESGDMFDEPCTNMDGYPMISFFCSNDKNLNQCKYD